MADSQVPSTSHQQENVPGSDINLFCLYCGKANRKILRLILNGQLSISLIQLTFRDGCITTDSQMTVDYYKICSLFHCDDPEPDKPSELQTEFFNTFIRRFSNYMNVDVDAVKKSIVNILNTPDTVMFDFDRDMLTEISRKTCQQIEDLICNVFWFPRVSANGKPPGAPQDWFDFAEPGLVIPCYLVPSNVDKKYLHCVHMIEYYMKSFTWYLPSGSVTPDSFLMYKKLSKKGQLNQGTAAVDDDKLSLNFTVHIFRFSFNGKCKPEKKCLFEHTQVIDSTRNPFINAQFPIILGTFDTLISKRVIHVVYKDNIKSADFFELLSELGMILTQMRIDTVTVHNCSTFKFRKIFKMLTHILHGGEVTEYPAVTMHG